MFLSDFNTAFNKVLVLYIVFGLVIVSLKKNPCRRRSFIDQQHCVSLTGGCLVCADRASSVFAGHELHGLCRMRGQKVNSSIAKGPRRNNKPAPGADAATTSPGDGGEFSLCEGCSKCITAEVRALQCDKCVGCWKCNECLNIWQEQLAKFLYC